MGSGIPLLNSYKQEFFWKRFTQTVLGGPKLRLGFCAPAFVYVSQVIVFLLPLVLGGLVTALVEFDVLNESLAGYISGSLMIVSVLIIQIIARISKKKSSVSPAPQSKGTNILSEEDDVEFDSCCSMETINFVTPPKKFIVNIILHALLSGPLVGMATWYLLPTALRSLYANIGATIMLFILGWFTVCIAQYSLSVGPPPETAVYRATDSYEVYSLTRPFYVLVCLSIHILDQYLSGFQLVNKVLHILLSVFPVFWTVGLLPPIDALFLWLMEQALVYLFGGSPMATDLRLFLMTLFSVICFLVVVFIPAGYQTWVIMAVLGYILSTDLGALGSTLLRCCSKKKEPRRLEHLNSGFLWQWNGSEIIFHICMMILVGGLAAVISYLFKTFGSANSGISSYISYAILGVLVLESILADLQSVYLFLGLIRSCVFPASVDMSHVFKPGKKRLIAVGHFRRTLVNFIAPPLMLVYLCVSFDFTVTDTTTVPKLNLLGALRAFRWISLILLLDLFDVAMSLGLGVQLMIICFIRNRLALVTDKIYFWFTLTIKSWTDPKQRRKSTAGLIACNFVLFPLVLAIICVSAVLAAPLFPLFTVPLFFIGYPRPLRFWPGSPGLSQNTCGDTVYYEQAAPQVARAFRDGFTSGSIGDGSPGSHYLVRFQDRLVWVQVLERGYCYCSLSIKGMELQETSCHTVEATRVDDILEETFESSHGLCCKRNNYPLHTVRPYDVRHIAAYSDAKSQLTGVIDSPDTLKTIKSCFMKTLIWVFLHHAKTLNKSSAKVVEKQSPTKKARQEEVSDNGLVKPALRISNHSLDTVDELSPRKNTQRPQSRGGNSINSFVNSMWSDDEDSLLGDSNNRVDKINLLHVTDNATQSKKVMGSLPPVEKKSQKSPAKSLHKQEDIDHLFEELEFGLPATDVNNTNRTKDTGPALGNSRSTTHTNAPNYHFSSSHSNKLVLPAKWTNIPLDEGKLRLFASQFDTEWFKQVILLVDSQSDQYSQLVAREMSQDKQLADMYSRVLTTCYAIIYDLGLSGNDVVSAGPGYVYKVYNGDIPWSVASDWLTEDKDLLAIVLKAFRYSVKLSIDQALLGEVSSPEELQEYLEEYDAQWYLGTEDDPQWNKCIVQAKPHLFSLAYHSDKTTYTSRVLSAQDTPVFISSLNPEAVHAQWANLNMEMLYMTNDDEERYSIQAHASLLRNLTVQAANPPLGYPIYASEPVSVPTL